MHSRCKPTKRYPPKVKNQKSKYQIAKYVSKKDFIRILKAADEIFSYSIPSNIQEALADPKWTQAIKEEMKALLKIQTWSPVDQKERAS